MFSVRSLSMNTSRRVNLKKIAGRNSNPDDRYPVEYSLLYIFRACIACVYTCSTGKVQVLKFVPRVNFLLVIVSAL